MRKILTVIPGCFLILLLFYSCSKGGDGGGGGVDCGTVSNKAFNADVFPITQGRCNLAGCHATGSTNGPGQLTNYNEIFAARAQIRSAVSAGRMPQGSTLSQSQKNSIICWIDGGAPNN